MNDERTLLFRPSIETDDSILFLATILFIMVLHRMGGLKLQLYCQCAYFFVVLFYYNQIICLVIQNKYGQGTEACACMRKKNQHTNTHIKYSNKILYVKNVSYCLCKFELLAWKKEKKCNNKYSSCDEHIA